jgi:hypothetical protein
MGKLFRHVLGQVAAQQANEKAVDFEESERS